VEDIVLKRLGSGRGRMLRFYTQLPNPLCRNSHGLQPPPNS